MSIQPKKLDFNVESFAELDVIPRAAGPTPKAHNRIQDWPAGSVPDDSLELTYTISMIQVARRLSLYFSSRPPEPAPQPGWAPPGPFEAWGVTRPCKITLKLDPGWDWEFDHACAIDFDNYPGATRYFNLRNNPLDQDGRFTSVSFHAERYTDKPGGSLAGRDRFTIYVNLTQADGSIMPGSFDPDIKNPGDDP